MMTSPSREHDSSERGSGTVLALGLVFVLLIFFVVIAGVITAVSAQHKAMAAADLSALAAADTARGLREGEPCTVAAEIARFNHAELKGCAQPEGYSGIVDVRTTVPIGGPFTWLGLAEGLSRAGPPE